MNKKGDLSMSTIVMAVIAVLILIVLASMVINNLSDASEGLQQCPGRCVDGFSCSDTIGISWQEHPSAQCLEGGQPSGQLCCVPG
jgi:hypothetical protein